MAQSRSLAPFPTTEISCEMKEKQNQEDEQEQEQEQQPLGLGSLPEDALVEILSRVPYSSLCRFKCVSKPWFALCSAPDIRKRSPQTLSGFFYYMPPIAPSRVGWCNLSGRSRLSFCNLSGRDPPLVEPSLPFLRSSYELLAPIHCCAGLVLCRYWKSHHSKADEYYLLVCNPATEKWTELPPCPVQLPYKEAKYNVNLYLGFNPAMPSRFVVFADLWESNEVTIYSSDTGQWTTVQSGWIYERCHIGQWECVFLNGIMHWLTTEPSIVTVDTEGKIWREIDIPFKSERREDVSIGQSQGRLYAWYIGNPNVCKLSVWALEDYDSAKWTLKHTVNILELFGRQPGKDGKSCKMFAIHPNHNLIFLTDGKENTITYDMDSREVHVIGTSKILYGAQPYIPCFAEWPSDNH